MTTVPKQNSQLGFSLLEVLIAVVVMSLGLLALASLQSALIRSAADSKAQSLAMAAAKQKIELLQSMESLGGADSGCVSPTDWFRAVNPADQKLSCYRMITDEPIPLTTPNVDGDPTTPPVNAATIEPLGGIAFRLGTTVTRYVFNKATNAYVSVNDTALSSALTTSPTTYIPGKEFKRVSVTVAWTDATNALRGITVEDSIPGVVPRDSIALLLGKKGVLPRKAEVIITNPGAVAGVIPIAVGNGSNTAASNPTPELLGSAKNAYVSETRFDVYTYIPLTETTALAQSRVETAVVGCRCSTAAASTTEAPLRPTYWDGLRYAVPTEANYVGPPPGHPTKNYPLAGPKPLSGGELEQSQQCRVCCRDHHDPAGNDANGDPYSAVAKVSPRRSEHTHNLVDATAGTLTPVTSGAYSEVCRMIRVDGIFRVAADLNNDYFALLEARNTGESSFVPSSLVADDYGTMVKKYLKDRFSDNTDSSTFNTATSPNPYDNAYVTGTRTLADSSTRAYDLNLPASYTLKLTQDARWLHARGLYIDYLEKSARDKIEAAQAICTAQSSADFNECVLPYLPFTSINLTELAAWKDVAVTPSGATTSQVINVTNNVNGFAYQFKDASSESTYTRGQASGTTGSTTISVDNSEDIPKEFEGMAVSGAGIAPNARVVSVDGSGNGFKVDLPNTGAVGPGLTFQTTPVVGVVASGTSAVAGNTSIARATASYNNAAIALKFPMHSDELPLEDDQNFVMSGSGPPSDPTAGSFDVKGLDNYNGNGDIPAAAAAPGNVTPPVLPPCSVVAGSPRKLNCTVLSGLGAAGGISLSIGNYNKPATKNYALARNLCHIAVKGKNVAYTAGGSDNVLRPYVLNYKVASATVNSGGAAAGSSPYSPVSSPTGAGQLTSETTTLFFNNIAQPVGVVNDYVTISLIKEDDPYGEISADLTCCLIKVSGTSITVTPTWKPNACPFTIP